MTAQLQWLSGGNWRSENFNKEAFPSLPHLP